MLLNNRMIEKDFTQMLLCFKRLKVKSITILRQNYLVVQTLNLRNLLQVKMKKTILILGSMVLLILKMGHKITKYLK
jgi:hypothetical protein